ASMLGTLESQGYKLQTSSADFETPSIIEAFPHPALLALCNCNYRVPYKVHKADTYWPMCPPDARRRNLIQEMQKILGFLKQEIAGIPLTLESKDAGMMTTNKLKAIEDMIDALVCEWVGIKYLAGDADAYGDETAAIWVPRRAAACDLCVLGDFDGPALDPCQIYWNDKELS